MSAIRSRRTRGTAIAAGLTVATLISVGVLGVVGLRTLADSTAGKSAIDEPATVELLKLPFTPTALIGTVDDAGRLTSVLVLAVDPSGVGGSIVSVAATADAAAGAGESLTPLNGILKLDGPESFRDSVEALTGLSFDVVELVDETRFAHLVGPLGGLAVDMPIALRDASTDEYWAIGESIMDPSTAARAVTASDPAVEDWYFEPGRAAIWRALAEVGGAKAAPLPSSAERAPKTLDDVVERIFASTVEFRALPFEALDAAAVADGLSSEMNVAFGVASIDAVVVHDRAEVIMAMTAIAPGRTGTPFDAPNYRVISAFDEPSLVGLGVNNSDVTKQVLYLLLYLRVNIVSVADVVEGGVPKVTVIEVANPATAASVRDSFATLLGDIEVRVAQVPIEGIDVVVILGDSYLTHLASGIAAETAGSSDDESA